MNFVKKRSNQYKLATAAFKLKDTYLEERSPKSLALHGSGIDAHISVTKHGFSSLKGELSGHQIKRYSNCYLQPLNKPL